MLSYTRIGFLIGALSASCMVWADDQQPADTSSYLNGYTAGRALAGNYENGDRQAYINGLLKGLGESNERAISEESVREARLAWFADAALSKKVQASYAAGYLSGDAYNKPESQYLVYVFLQGMMDSLQNTGAAYVGKEQGTALVTQYQRGQFYKMKRQVADNIKANESAGGTFLATNALQPGISQTDSGLQFRIINAGHGISPTGSDTVVVSLVGRKIDGEIFYDSLTDGEGKPTTLKVNQTLDGWQEALVGMSTGAEWELFLPAELAYQHAGWQDKVEPGEALIYRLKLIEVLTAQ
jgi:FKBP-type peptidyl-prolyl cis-trans isomerase FklB